MKTLNEILDETTERIVIQYANLSGRESENRAVFRQEVEKILRTTLLSVAEEASMAGVVGAEIPKPRLIYTKALTKREEWLKEFKR